jgi:hypothetical protein
MAFAEYQLRQYLHIGWVREKDSRSKWLLRNNKQSTAQVSLDDEIYQLRRKLEQLVLDEKSLTSQEVVEISVMLDKKINEYMIRPRGNR